MTSEVVYVRDASNGRIHKRVRVAGVKELASFEGCQADQSGDYTVVTDADLTDSAAYCGRCFAETGETDG